MTTITRYRSGSPGKLTKLTIKLEEPRRSAAEERLLKEATQAARNAAQ
jgi:hypothetical protein